MALSLKITLTSAGTTKTMRFTPDMSVSEAAKEIRDKTGTGGNDHGIFQPGSATQKPRWLKPEKTLRYYDLQSGMELEYKKKHRQLKIKLLDDTVKTVLVDDSSNVNKITEVIGTRMGIKNPEEFSLKIQTSNIWLNPALTLQEQGVKEDEVLLLKKKFFFNDANVDRSDPVQLHLLYVQSVDAIVSGDHPTTRDESRDLAALQCQVQFGDYNPQKHKPGFFPLKDFVPPAHQKSKNIDKDIIKEFQKLVNMSEINAKYRYIQLCRSLKTYGITFFNVKVKVKKKLQPQLLGITRHAILQMDAETKEVYKEFPLTHLKRWAPSSTSISMDFGDYEDDYLTVSTTEGEAISQLISGYIDIILKTRKDAARIIEDDEGDTAQEEILAPVRGMAIDGVTSISTMGAWDPSQGQAGQMGVGGQMGGRSMMGGQQGTIVGVVDLASALNACQQLIDQILNPAEAIAGAEAVSLGMAMTALGTAAGELAAAAPGGGAPLDAAASALHQNLKNLIAAAKQAAAQNGDDVSLLDGAKAISEAVRKLLQAAGMVAKDPNDPRAIEALRAAQLALKGATTYLGAASAGNLADAPSQNLLLETAKMVAAATASLVSMTEPAIKGMGSSRAQQDAFNKAKSAAGAAQRLITAASTVAPAILDPTNQHAIALACKALSEANQALIQALAAGGVDEATMMNLNDAAKKVSEAIAQLMNSTGVAGRRGHEPQDFITPVQNISKEVSKLNADARSTPTVIAPCAASIYDSVQQLIKATKVLAEEDPSLKGDLLEAAKVLATAVAKLNDFSRKAAQNPSDAYTMQQLQSNAALVEDASKGLLKTARSAVVESVKYWAKAACASTSGLVACATACSNKADPQTKQSLNESAIAAAQRISDMLGAIQRITNSPGDTGLENALVSSAKGFAHPAASLVATAKRSVPRITDINKKTALHTAAEDVAQALKKLMLAVQAAADEGPTKEVTEALEQLNFITADLEAAAFAAEAGALPKIMGSPDAAVELLNFAVQNLKSSLPPLEDGARTSPQEVGPPAKTTSGAVYQVVNAAKTLASYAPDSESQKKIIQTAKALVSAGYSLIEAAMALSHSPKDASLDQAMVAKEEDIHALLNKLLNVSRGVDTNSLDDASSTLEAEADRIQIMAGSPGGDFNVLVSELLTSAKALVAAIQSVATMAESNTKGLVPAAQMAASAVSPFVNAANSAATHCPDKQAGSKIVSASRGMATGGAQVIKAAKGVATTGSSESKQDLHQGTQDVNGAMEELMQALGSAQPGQKEIRRALEALEEIMNKLDVGGPTKGTSLQQLTEACKSLGQATSNILASARTDPKQLGNHSLNAATALEDIVDATRTAISKLGQSTALPPEFGGPGQRILTELDLLSNSGGDKSQGVHSAKEIALATTEIVGAAKNQAQTLTDDNSRRNLILATEKLANATTALAKAARTGIKPAHIQATKDAVRDLNSAVGSTGTNPATEQLLAATRAVADSTSKLLNGASAVCSNPRDNSQQNKLSSAAKVMPQAISAVQNAATGLSPGVKECDDAIAEVENAMGDLESAGIAAAFGQLETPAGKTHQDCQQELIRATKSLAEGVGQLKSGNLQGVANAAKGIQSNLPAFVGFVKAAAATTSNRETQNSLIDSAKALSEAMLALLHATRAKSAGTGSPNDVEEKAVATNQAIAAFASSLKTGVHNLKELDEALAEIQQSVNVLSLPATSKAYQQCKVELKTTSQDMVKDVQELVNNAKVNITELGATAKTISAQLPRLLDATRDAAASTADPNAKNGLINGGKSVVNTTANLVNVAKKVANDPKNQNIQKELSNAFTAVTTSITSLLDACYAGAIGERECEDAAVALGRIIADLDASSLFAAAGQIDPAEIAPGKNYEDCQNEIKAHGNKIILAASQFRDSMRGSQEQLAAGAKAIAAAGENLSKYTKATGALGGDKTAQQTLIDACKKVEIECQNLLNKGKGAHGKVDTDTRLEQQISDSVDLISNQVSELINTAEQAAAESARGIMEIDKATRSIGNFINEYQKPTYKGNTSADAEAVVKGARGVAAATGELVVNVGSSQEELIASTKTAIETVKTLLENAKGGAATSSERDVRLKVEAAALASAQGVVKLLEACKAGTKGQSLQVQAKVSSTARECADSLQELVSAANLLPGGQGLTLEEDTGEDLDDLAEKELRACAQVIENAAKTLVSARGNATKGTDSVLEDVAEAILAAAIAIAQATAVLVRAAHSSQKERVSTGRNPKTKHLYRKDPTWANGLISAAQKVAATTQHLTKSANDAVLGKAEDEVLVASAKAVAASTAQLVAASRAKADPNSSTQKALANAAKAVAAATSQLVEAARSRADHAREEEMMNKKYDLDTSAKAEMQHQIEILKLEKQLEEARRKLLQNRSEQYKNAGGRK